MVTYLGIPPWRIGGSLIGVCNCDWGCPCNFDAPPTYGACQGAYVWYVEQGNFGDIILDGLYVGAGYESPGPIHEGHVTAQSIIDERADQSQRDALLTLLEGDAGGPFAILAGLIETGLRPIFAPYEALIDGMNSWVKVPGVLEIGLTSIKNPVTGDPEEIHLVKPTGFTSIKSEMGASTVYRFTGGFQHDHSGKYAEFAPFDYSGP